MWEKHLNELKEVYAKKETQKVRDEIKSLTKKIAQMNELWQFYELYTTKMRELNYIDFSDMINMVLDRMEDKDSSLLEEIAYKYGWISRAKLLESAERYGKSPYGAHLRNVAEDKLKY